MRHVWLGRKCITVDGKFVGNLAKRLLFAAVVLLGIQIMIKSCGAAVPEAGGGRKGIGNAMLESFAEDMKSWLYGQFTPCIAFSAENNHRTYWLLQEQVDSLIPFYAYLTEGDAMEGEEAMDFRTILLAEAEEGTYQEEEDVAGEGLPDASGLVQGGTVQEEPEGETLDDLLKAENEAALGMREIPATGFVPHARLNQVDLALLDNYETLVQQFYTVDANTSAGSDQLNVGKFLEADLSISKEGEGPQILIYHTHSRESFSDSVAGDSSTSIVGVGERLADILRNEYGYEVMHYLGQYDVDSRDDAYSNALADMEEVLKANPSVQVVIDLHRDEMPEGTRLVMDLDGRPTARFMFFNGLSRTKKTGNIAYLYNGNLDGNLAFSFQMQLKAMEYYPGLTRKIYLKGYRYNMHLCSRYLLIELGAQNNTVEEAMNACDPLAHILDMVLSGQ